MAKRLWRRRHHPVRGSWRVGVEGQAVDATRSNFDFKEKEQVDKYYPQYYHKTDKVAYFL